MSTYRPKFKPYDEVLKSATRRVPMLPDRFYNGIPAEMRKFAFTISNIERVSEINDVLTSMNKAIADGVPFEQWRDTVKVESFSNLAKFRQETVFRTHSQTAYNQGIYEVYRDDPELFPFLLYQAILDDRTRPNHAANDGILRPADDDFWRTNLPPIGFGCRCFVLNVTDRQKEKNYELTPKAKTQSDSVKPDYGWSYDKLNPDKALTKYFTEKSGDMPKDISKSAMVRFLKKNEDTEVWWEKNRSKFEK